MSSPQQTTPVKRARKQNRAKEVIVAEKAAKVAREAALRSIKQLEARRRRLAELAKKSKGKGLRPMTPRS